jgi:hypothetical protein
MPEKVTSLNGLKVTSEYGYTLGAYKIDYVKSSFLSLIFNQLLKSWYPISISEPTEAVSETMSAPGFAIA